MADPHKKRYRVIPIDLSIPVFNPEEISAANGRIVTFIRFAQDADGRYPQQFTNDSFQIALDDCQEFIPFKPNDSIRSLSNQPFSRVRYRNLIQIDGWAFILVSEDICIDNQRPDIIRPLKNVSEPEIEDADTLGTAVSIAAGGTNGRNITVPGGTMILIWNYNVWQYPADETTRMVPFYTALLFNGVIKKSWTRLSIEAQNFDSSHVEWDPPEPMEIVNTGVGGANLGMSITNLHSATAQKFGRCMSYSLLPINAASDPVGDMNPLQ